MSNGGFIGPTITTTGGWIGSASGVFSIIDVGSRRLAGTYPLPGIIYGATDFNTVMRRFRVSTETYQSFNVSRRASRAPGCFATSTFGYACGQWFQPFGTTDPEHCDKMAFATETFSAIGDITPGRGYSGTAKSDTDAYVAGGEKQNLADFTSPFVFSTINKMPFATETFSTLAGTVTYSGRTSSVQSDTNGYFLHVGAGGVTDDQTKVVFATDTVSSISIPRVCRESGRWNRTGHSYIVGGLDAAGNNSFTNIDKFNHSTETLSTTSMTLLGESFGANRGRHGGVCDSVGDIGYFLGGMERLSGSTIGPPKDGLRYDLITETRTNNRIALEDTFTVGTASGPGFATPQ
jgi:hypothetical protein